MAKPYEHVNYDFGAAADVSSLLAEATRRINEFGNLRTNQGKIRLGVHPCDNWQGVRRGLFDGKVASEQATLRGLAGEVHSLLRAVEQATAEAHAVNTGAH
ncbi:hypothetical protein [Streptomyces sp. NPDC002172]